MSSNSIRINQQVLAQIQADLTALMEQSIMAANQKAQTDLQIEVENLNNEFGLGLQVNIDQSLSDELLDGTGRRFLDDAQKQIKQDFGI